MPITAAGLNQTTHRFGVSILASQMLNSTYHYSNSSVAQAMRMSPCVFALNPPMNIAYEAIWDPRQECILSEQGELRFTPDMVAEVQHECKDVGKLGTHPDLESPLSMVLFKNHE